MLLVSKHPERTLNNLFVRPAIRVAKARGYGVYFTGIGWKSVETVFCVVSWLLLRLLYLISERTLRAIRGGIVAMKRLGNECPLFSLFFWKRMYPNITCSCIAWIQGPAKEILARKFSTNSFVKKNSRSLVIKTQKNGSKYKLLINRESTGAKIND